MNRKKLTTKRINRKTRVRSKLKAKSILPRLVVTRSLKHISAQVIDTKGVVQVSATSKNQPLKGKTKTEQAAQVGQEIANKLNKKGITATVLDRGHYKYHGRIKALSEAAIKNGH